MARCHGCFNMLPFCTCADEEYLFDPETGRAYSRAEFDAWLHLPPTQAPGGHIQICMDEESWQHLVAGELDDFQQFVAFVEADRQARRARGE